MRDKLSTGVSHSLVKEDNAAGAVEYTPVALCYDVLACLHADNLLQHLQLFPHYLERTALSRRHAIDNIQL
ncbi:hypothetical protein, partial [Agrobacterium sp. MCAB5]|uniref:hypothetical protein n=1 Tax=Agrobacterium sp. MCAB5 TaxID=3233042 RepID=UPI003F8F4382